MFLPSVRASRAKRYALSYVSLSTAAGKGKLPMSSTRVSMKKTLPWNSFKVNATNQQVKKVAHKSFHVCTIHAESILPAIDAQNKEEFLSLLEKRKTELTASQLARLKSGIKSLQVN